MLVWVRKLLESWVARGFFALLVVMFLFWGISNVLTLVGGQTAVAWVAGKPVDISAVQAAYQKALERASAQIGHQPDLETRKQLAASALAGVLRRDVLRREEAKLGLAAPDAAVHDLLASIPAFQTNGAFDKAKFAQLLQQNNISQDEFIGEARDDVLNRQLMQPVLSGMAPSDELLSQLFTFLAEQRFADLVQISSAAQKRPAAPSEAVLKRYWTNHPRRFTAPEYRKIKLVVLSPALLAPKEQVPQAELNAAYARAKDQSPSAPARSVQVLAVDNLAASSQLEAAWKKGADWAAIQAMAKRYGANAVTLTKATQSQIPSSDLAKAVFAAKPGRVVGPVAGENGMYVFKVTATGQSGPDPAQLKAQVTQQLQMQMAEAEVAQNVNKLQDALAGQTPLDQLPGNLGLVALTGTLDQQGTAPDGTPAPIPGGDKLKAAIIKAAFAAQEGDPAQLINGPGNSYFALTVDSVTPPAVRPFASVHDQVLADWTNDAMTREAEVKAADLMHGVNTGQSLQTLAAAAHETITQSSGLTRGSSAPDVPSNMVSILFTLKPGHAAMLQTKSGFMVAVLTKVAHPTPADDQDQYDELRRAMTRALQNDTAESFLDGLQTRYKVRVNQKLFAQIYQ